MEEQSYWTRETTQAMRAPGGRDLKSYQEHIGFELSELENLTIVDLGSGSKEKFSNELKNAGVKANVISINPDYVSKKWRRIATQQENWQGKSVAALAQALPIKDKSADRIFAVDSISYYLDPVAHPEEARQSIQEILRVLKFDGKAVIADIPAFSSEKVSKAYEKIFKLIKDAGFTYKVETFKLRETNAEPRYRLIIEKTR